MEIIHRGQAPGDVWYSGQCTNCTTRARWQKKEEKTPILTDGRSRIDCPVCQRSIYGNKDVKQTATYTNSSSYMDR